MIGKMDGLNSAIYRLENISTAGHLRVGDLRKGIREALLELYHYRNIEREKEKEKQNGSKEKSSS